MNAQLVGTVQQVQDYGLFVQQELTTQFQAKEH